MVLLLGRSGNNYEVYINGILLNSTGEIQNVNSKEKSNNDIKKQLTTYTIPKNLLKSNCLNLVSVKVLNMNDNNALMEGPVGIIKPVTLTKYQKELVLSDY